MFRRAAWRHEYERHAQLWKRPSEQAAGATLTSLPVAIVHVSGACAKRRYVLRKDSVLREA
jgi:hypothetical protein